MVASLFTGITLIEALLALVRLNAGTTTSAPGPVTPVPTPNPPGLHSIHVEVNPTFVNSPHFAPAHAGSSYFHVATDGRVTGEGT